MIKTETITINNKQFIRTYSNKGMMIHGGLPEADYSEAFDPVGFERIYTETNIPIEDNETSTEEILNILTGDAE
jgi:hypothetical protein